MSLLNGTKITWLGHSTVSIQTARGTNLLIDPFIAQSSYLLDATNPNQ